MSEVAGSDLATGPTPTPWGTWWLVASRRGVVRLALAGPGPEDVPRAGLPEAADLLARLQGQIASYLGGERRFFDLPLDLPPATAFQRRVWEACARIPYGVTIAYGTLAEAVGSPKGARAVGQALGGNPVPVLIPCHRIVASDGSLGGYVGGLPLKRALLALERGARAR